MKLAPISIREAKLYAIERPDLPSSGLVRIRCGGWVQALRMAERLRDRA